MIRIVSLSAALSALVLTPAAMADDADDAKVIEVGTVDESPVKLVSFDGEKQFLKASSRLRVWRADVGYKMTVDAEGNATECELTEKFRRAYVNKRLCKVLMQHHEFEPAHDSSGAPVEGSYTARLNYLEIRNKM